MRINIKLFSVSLILALVSGTITGFFQYFFPYWMNLPNFQSLGELWIVLDIAVFIINPIVILVVYYYLGKKYDLSKLLGMAVVSIFSGLVIGFLLTYIVLYSLSAYIFSLASSDNFLVYYLYLIFLAIASSVSMFFVMFASLAIGYFRGNQGKSALHSNGSAEAINSSTT